MLFAIFIYFCWDLRQQFHKKIGNYFEILFRFFAVEVDIEFGSDVLNMLAGYFFQKAGPLRFGCIGEADAEFIEQVIEDEGRLSQGQSFLGEDLRMMSLIHI